MERRSHPFPHSVCSAHPALSLEAPLSDRRTGHWPGDPLSQSCLFMLLRSVWATSGGWLSRVPVLDAAAPWSPEPNPTWTRCPGSHLFISTCKLSHLFWEQKRWSPCQTPARVEGMSSSQWEAARAVIPSCVEAQQDTFWGVRWHLQHQIVMVSHNHRFQSLLSQNPRRTWTTSCPSVLNLREQLSPSTVPHHPFSIRMQAAPVFAGVWTCTSWPPGWPCEPYPREARVHCSLDNGVNGPLQLHRAEDPSNHHSDRVRITALPTLGPSCMPHPNHMPLPRSQGPLDFYSSPDFSKNHVLPLKGLTIAEEPLPRYQKVNK